MVSTLWPSAPISWPPVCACCLDATNEKMVLSTTQRFRSPHWYGSNVEDTTGTYVPMCSPCKEHEWIATQIKHTLWITAIFAWPIAVYCLIAASRSGNSLLGRGGDIALFLCFGAPFFLIRRFWKPKLSSNCCASVGAVKFEATAFWAKHGNQHKLFWNQRFYFRNQRYEALVLSANTRLSAASTPSESLKAEQANEERRQTEQRVREREERQERERITKLRRLTGKCIMCGKPLAWITRFLGTEKHRGCTHFSFN
jgi:RNA polymerase-binding transcription factor DksA